ncbi:MAG: NUDIX hydrolase [Gordonia sp. (in: high G+C Gram-positive bacteria)]
MSSPARTVWAGGGVLWRRCSGGDVEVALVHRRRYDDWSLPKGKAECGEILVATAAREITEETGFDVRMGHQIRTVEYQLKSGARKKVGYWAAEAVGGEFVTNHETDRLKWLSTAQAMAKTSYAADRKVLRDFTVEPVEELHSVAVVRHAKAGRRSRFRGDDRQRPLDADGRKQAQALVEVLGLFGVHRLYAADRLRCVQTFEPLAETLRTDVTVVPELTEEAYRADPDLALATLRELCAGRSPVRAICSQGKAIPPLLESWAGDDGVALPSSRNRKGSTWILTLRGDRLVFADYYPSPLPPAVGR